MRTTPDNDRADSLDETSTEMQVTRRRILDAALPLFAEKGVDGVSVREICAAAGANVAAVNYHFGGKAALYVAVLGDAMSVIRTRLAEEASKREADPMKRLRGFIAAMCRTLLGDGTVGETMRLLWLTELARPSVAFPELVETFMRPNFVALRGTLEELVPSGTDPRRLDMMTISVIAQIVHYVHAAPIIRRVSSIAEYPREFSDELARHVFDMTIGGIGLAASDGANDGRRTS